MRKIVLNRQLLGLEDLLFGVGIVTQTRAGQSVDITRINASNMPFDETQTLLEWAQSVNLENLGNIVDELQAIYDNLTVIGNVEDSLLGINTLEDNLLAIQSLYTNIAKLQNIDTNMSKLQNIYANMSKLQNIDANMSKLQAIYADLAKLESLYANLTMLTSIYNNLTALNNINSQVIPNLTELLLVNDNAAQVASDKLAVAADKVIVAGYKSDVTSMKLAVESIYDAFDDRFLGTKTIDPIVDNDGNTLIDGAMYFNTSSNALKVYSLDNTTWYTIPQIYLSGLLDVQLTSITTGDILTWNGTKWVNTRTPSFNSIKLNGGTGTAGTSIWNNTELTYDVVLNDNVTLQVGQEEVVYCKNSTLTTIPNGKPVMAVGTNGNSGNILIDLHDGTKASAKRIIGLTTQSILPSTNANPYGFVTRNGKVRGLNTTGSDYGESWLDGAILYVKATGALTNVEPLDTALKMPIAFVIHAHTNGTLYVRTTGIDENHDIDLIATKVAKVTSTDNAIVRFDGTTGNVKNSGIIIDNNDCIGLGRYPGIYNGYRTLTISGVDTSHGGVLELVNSDLSSSAQIFNTTDRLNIGTNTNHPIVFNTGNTERMRIEADGDILMPSNKTISIGGTSNNYFYADAIGNIEVYGGKSVNLVVNGQNRLKIDSNGVLNVTSSPTNGRINVGASSNYIYGDTSGNFIVCTENTDRVNITSNGILVGNSNNGQKCIGINHETGVIQSYQHNTTMNIPLIFNPASGGGNLLVGTTTDNGVDKLQVNGSISDSVVRYISSSFNTNSRIRVTISLPENTGSSGRIEVIRTRGVNTFFNTVFGRQYNETPTGTDINGTTTKTITTNQIILEYEDVDGLNDMYSVVGYVTKNCTVTVTTY